MTSSTDFPSLKQFFGAYLHQDWCDEFGSPDEAINAFQAGEPAENVSAAKRELDELMKSNSDDTSLAESLRRLGCFYDPSGDGLSYREWLAKVNASFN